MLVTITIVIIVSGMSIAGVITFNQIQGNEDDSKSLLTELRWAYSQATGVSYPAGVACTSLTGYQITIPASSISNKQTDITVTAKCSEGDRPVTRAGVLKNSYFSNSDTAQDFIIKTGTGQLQAVASTTLPITIKVVSNNNATTFKNIDVRDFGVFNIQ